VFKAFDFRFGQFCPAFIFMGGGSEDGIIRIFPGKFGQFDSNVVEGRIDDSGPESGFEVCFSLENFKNENNPILINVYCFGTC